MRVRGCQAARVSWECIGYTHCDEEEICTISKYSLPVVLTRTIANGAEPTGDDWASQRWKVVGDTLASTHLIPLGSYGR